MAMRGTRRVIQVDGGGTPFGELRSYDDGLTNGKSLVEHDQALFGRSAEAPRPGLDLMGKPCVASVVSGREFVETSRPGNDPVKKEVRKMLAGVITDSMIDEIGREWYKVKLDKEGQDILKRNSVRVPKGDLFPGMVQPPMSPKAAMEHLQAVANKDFVVFDTETTGLLESDQIVSITILNRRGAELFSSRIKPTCRIAEGASAVHGIYAKDLVNEPSFADVYPKIVAALGARGRDGVAVAYNFPFDSRMLRQSAEAHGLPPIEVTGTCMMETFRALIDLPKTIRLADACKKTGITLSNAHTSYGDAAATRNMLLVLSGAKSPEVDTDFLRGIGRTGKDYAQKQ